MSEIDTARQQLLEILAEPFHPDEVKFKPQSIKNGRALAVAYIDARCVMDRLDWALGVGNWQATYREAPDGVVCRLRVRIGEEWIEHEDFGSLSEQPDAGDKYKAAFSDALKRVAVHLGIGRYLYRLPHRWVGHDGRNWLEDPAKILIEANAVPYQMQRGRQQPQQTNGSGHAAQPTAQQRVKDYEAKLVQAGLCQAGDLTQWLHDEFGANWPGAVFEELQAACKEFKEGCQQRAKQPA